MSHSLRAVLGHVAGPDTAARVHDAESAVRIVLGYTRIADLQWVCPASRVPMVRVDSALARLWDTPPASVSVADLVAHIRGAHLSTGGTTLDDPMDIN